MKSNPAAEDTGGNALATLSEERPQHALVRWYRSIPSYNEWDCRSWRN
jgi:hypothetical protein